MAQQIAPVDPHGGSVDLALRLRQVERRADRGDRGEARVGEPVRIGGQAEHHVAAQREAEGVEAAVAGELGAAERGVQVGGQAGVVVVLAAAVGAAQVEQQRREAGAPGGQGAARHVMALDGAAEAVHQHHRLRRPRRLGEQAGEADRPQRRVRDHPLPRPRRRSGERAQRVAQARTDRPQMPERVDRHRRMVQDRADGRLAPLARPHRRGRAAGRGSRPPGPARRGGAGARRGPPARRAGDAGRGGADDRGERARPRGAPRRLAERDPLPRRGGALGGGRDLCDGDRGRGEQRSDRA